MYYRSRIIFQLPNRLPLLIVMILAASILLTGCAADERAGTLENAIDRSVLQLAELAERNADYDVASVHYQKLYKIQPENLDIVLGLVRNLRYAGYVSNGLQVLAKEQVNFSDDADFVLEYGKSLVASGDKIKAIKKLEQVAILTPENWQVYSALGIAYDLDNDRQGARRSYQKALEMSPDNPDVLNNMAISEALFGNVDEAIQILNKIVRKYRGATQVRQNLAFFYGITGNMEKAKTLAKMDLDEEGVRKNIALYSKFKAK